MPSGQTKIKAKAENGQFKNNVKTSQSLIAIEYFGRHIQLKSKPKYALAFFPGFFMKHSGKCSRWKDVYGIRNIWRNNYHQL